MLTGIDLAIEQGVSVEVRAQDGQVVATSILPSVIHPFHHITVLRPSTGEALARFNHWCQCPNRQPVLIDSLPSDQRPAMLLQQAADPVDVKILAGGEVMTIAKQYGHATVTITDQGDNDSAVGLTTQEALTSLGPRLKTRSPSDASS